MARLGVCDSEGKTAAGGVSRHLLATPGERQNVFGFATMPPKVLISDRLSPAAVQIFKDHGVAVDVKAGLDKDQLADIIAGYDGLAIRSATKVTAKLLARAEKLK